MNMICEYWSKNGIENINKIALKDTMSIIRKAQTSARKVMAKTDREHVLYAVTCYTANDNIEKILIFRNIELTDDELDSFIIKYPNSRYHVLHKGTCQDACKELIKNNKNREIKPITLKVANEFVNRSHRHHSGTVGCKFAVGLYENEKLIGVAICGRPVSRYLDNGTTCEINRLCTLGDANACSMLYGACSRIARNMGYKKIITYILKSESGITLKASNFKCDGEAGGTHWTGKRNKGQNIPREMKIRWSKDLAS